jgi:hypothetical protein
MEALAERIAQSKWDQDDETANGGGFGEDNSID